MILLVIGLAAVVVLILIAAFLSIRLGRGDDRDEPEPRPLDRARDRREAGDERRRDRDARAARRAPAEGARSSRGAGQRSHAGGESARGRERTESGRERGTDSRAREYGYSGQPSGRRGDAADYGGGSSRRAVSAATDRRSGRGRVADRADASQRARRGGGTVTYRSGSPYGAGVSPGPHGEDFPSGEFTSPGYPAADFPSGEFSPSGYPVADFPSGEFSSPGYPAADFPSGEYPASEFPSGEFPVADFPSGEFPVADFPSGKYPPAPARKASARGGDASRERPESRRKSGKQAQPGKGRARQQRGKRDDDDWPSTEWDKLSDEQYWAELSADKPLATTARTAQPASPAAAAAPAAVPDRASAASRQPGSSRQPPESAARPATADPGDRRDRPAGNGRAGYREPAAERVPARSSRQQPATPGTGTPPSPPRPGAPTDHRAGAGSPSARSRAPLDDDPLTSPSFSRRATPVADSRSYGSARARPPVADAGTHHRDGDAGRAGYSSGTAGASLDSTGGGAAGGNGGYDPGSYQAPGYGYPADPPTAVGWYSPAVEQTPAHGNPYQSYPDAEPGGFSPAAPPGYGLAPGGAGDRGYGGDTSSSSGYQQPAYRAEFSAPYPGPSTTATPGAAVNGAGYAQYPPDYPELNGYGRDEPGQPPYRDAYDESGYASGYPGEYAHPYHPEGYEGYQAQG